MTQPGVEPRTTGELSTHKTNGPGYSYLPLLIQFNHLFADNEVVTSIAIKQ